MIRNQLKIRNFISISAYTTGSGVQLDLKHFFFFSLDISRFERLIKYFMTNL